MAFGKKNKETNSKISGSVTILSAGASIEGNLKLSADAGIDGLVNGNIESKKRIAIGERGCVVGDVSCEYLELHGKIEGNVVSKKAVRLHSTAVLRGDLHAPQFSIEMGAVFVGVSKGQQVDVSKKDEDNAKK